jgi:anti-anti-sigma factor
MPAPSPNPCLEITRVGSTTIARIVPELLLDDRTIQVLAAQLDQAAQQVGSGMLVVDFSKVAHMASGMLGKLLILNHKLQTAGGRLGLCGINSAIRLVLEVTTLDKTFCLFRDVAEALQGV